MLCLGKILKLEFFIKNIYRNIYLNRKKFHPEKQLHQTSKNKQYIKRELQPDLSTFISLVNDFHLNMYQESHTGENTY